VEQKCCKINVCMKSSCNFAVTAGGQNQALHLSPAAISCARAMSCIFSCQVLRIKQSGGYAQMK
jgi:hypothetical protein